MWLPSKLSESRSPQREDEGPAALTMELEMLVKGE